MSSSMISTDRIEKQIRLTSPRSRVWRALTDSRQFGKWFGADVQGAFTPGATVRAQITARGYEHVSFDVVVESVEPEHHFAFRWHPYAIEPGVDYSTEPRTLVDFTLKEVDGDTLLTVVESGFDDIPASRRVKAFEMDSKGWAGQLVNIQKYLAAQG
ncbi:MAG: SRPBCC family protein [Gemmatimonadaceae bacterium]